MLHAAQRFLQEHGEVQLSALGLGVFHLSAPSLCLVSCAAMALCQPHCIPMRIEGPLLSVVPLVCSYLFNGDGGRDSEERAMGC